MTMTAEIEIERLDGPGARQAVGSLAEILRDCVDGGASVSFLAPLSRERAEAFWEKVAGAVDRGETALLVARDADGVRGTVQVLVSLPENQPHRAEIAKLLVHRRARRRGIAEAPSVRWLDASECGGVGDACAASRATLGLRCVLWGGRRFGLPHPRGPHAVCAGRIAGGGTPPSRPGHRRLGVRVWVARGGIRFA